MWRSSRTVDEEVADVAARQHGVITRAQLLGLGISPSTIDRRLRDGALLREHPGVYRVGHRAPSVEATYLAVVLACGEGALLSGRAAAHLLGLLRSAPPVPEVTTRTERLIEGIRTRRCRKPDPRDAMVFRGIPVTTVARTVADLAADLSLAALGRAWHEADVRYRTTPDDVEAVLARRPTAKGARKLRRILSGDERVTLSTLEQRFLKLLREHRLPLPETNRPAGSKRVDCRWPKHRLTVELDSYRYHRTRYAWEQDRRREREAHARGDQIRRYTWTDVVESPAAMLRELQSVLLDHRQVVVIQVA